MKVQISFKIINPDFDQAYADQYQEGKESDGNWKYEWATTYEVDNAIAVKFINEEVYQLKIKNVEDEIESIPIPNIAIFRIVLENGKEVDFGVSKSILKKTHQAQNPKYDVIRFYFYVNAEPESIQLGKNLLINVNEIPEELKKQNS